MNLEFGEFSKMTGLDPLKSLYHGGEMDRGTVLEQGSPNYDLQVSCLF